MVVINPWASQQFKNYEKLRDQFGIEEFKFELEDMPPLFRRKIIFGHRGFQWIYRRIKEKRSFAVLTGLMPSGKMHLGHKMTIDQVVYYQRKGGDVHIAVADIEAYASRGIPLDKARKIALEEYVPSYIALGLNPEKTEVYFQSRRREVKDLAWKLAKKINLNEFMKIYGFAGDTNMSHIFSPLIQVGDILHVQLEKFGGLRPTIVPVGVDQDPHIRLTRDIVDRWRMFSVIPQDDEIGIFYRGDDAGKVLRELASLLESSGYEVRMNIPYNAIYTRGDKMKIEEMVIEYEKELNEFAFYSPSATYHRLMTGLTGEKMSSSIPESAIFLSDDDATIRKKVMNSITGGGVTLEEHRKYGGKPEKCSVYELFAYHLVLDDSYLADIYEECTSGRRTCGPCKREAVALILEWFQEFREKREWAKDFVAKVVSND